MVSGLDTCVINREVAISIVSANESRLALVTVPTQVYPVQIYVICDYYIYKTDLTRLIQLQKKLEIFVANIVISFTFRIREFTT